MDRYKVIETFETPMINFDANKGVLEIEGRSIPNLPDDFYHPVLKLLDEYSPKKGLKTKVRIQMYYCNTSSAKCIFRILRKIDEIYKKGHEVEIRWEYEEGDDDTVLDGEEFRSLLKVPFKIVQVKE